MNRNRQQEIVEILSRRGTISNAEIMAHFGISIETVRRDLNALEKQGLIEKVYGGAALNTPIKSEPEYTNREKKNAAEKDRIAKIAVAMIEDEDAVYLDVGTTTQAMARYAAGRKNVTAVTNSLRAAIAFSEIEGYEVILPGGKLRKMELSISGGIAVEDLDRFNINKAFIGVGGINESGIMDFDLPDALIRKYVIDHADRVILLADHSKFGVKAKCNVCKMDKIDVLITDSEAPAAILKKIEKQGVKVIIAE